MNWKNYLEANEGILLGKLVVKGTRISVEFVISLLAQGWTEDLILENYPALTRDSLQAVFAYILDCLRDGLLFSPEKLSA